MNTLVLNVHETDFNNNKFRKPNKLKAINFTTQHVIQSCLIQNIHM